MYVDSLCRTSVSAAIVPKYCLEGLPLFDNPNWRKAVFSKLPRASRLMASALPNADSEQGDKGANIEILQVMPIQLAHQANVTTSPNVLFKSKPPSTFLIQLFLKNYTRNAIMDIEEPFTYTSLAPDQFRLFCLAGVAPEDRDSELVGYLETVSWLNGPHHQPYEALSYVWGSDEKPHVFNLINEDFHGVRQLPITSSLYNALRSLRPFGFCKRMLWIDAICINQQDDGEKNYQVQAMARIYREATTVIGYLGEAVENIEEGNALVQTLMKFNEAHAGKSEIEVEEDAKDLPPEDYPGWKSVRHFVTSKWPTRTWVLQEAILAKKLVLMTGSYEINPVTYFLLAVGLATKTLPAVVDMRLKSEDEEDGSLKSIIDLQLLKNHVRRGVAIDEIIPSNYFNGITLGHCLIQARNTICKDPRDKIYALMGIADDGFTLGIEIDYSKSVEDVYKEAVYKMFKSVHGVDILCHASGAKNLDLPSWVPDWSITKNLYHDETNNFSAGRAMPFMFGCTPDRNKLLLRCIIIDRIEALFPFQGLDQEHTVFDIDNLVPFLSRTLAIAHHPKVQAKYEDAVDSMGIALISNRMDEKSADCFIWYAKFIQQACRIMEETDEQKKAELNKPTFPIDLLMEYWQNLRRTGSHAFSNRLLVTDQGYLGNTGSWAKERDLVIIAYGSNIPFVIRPAAEKDAWILIGPCYVEGFMQGQAFEDGKPKDGYTEQNVYLV
jgi:hypothetical protein